MKTNYFTGRSIFTYLTISLSALLLVSCGAQRGGTYYDSDGIYGNSDRQNNNTNNYDGQSNSDYANYFGSLRSEDSTAESFTDVDNYSSSYSDNSQSEGYNSGWGDTGNVTVNVYGNSWGYGNSWYGNYWNSAWGWDSWYYPGFYGYGYSGFYSPFIGWGYNNYYSPYYGGYYGNYYGNNYGNYGGYYNNGYAYSNGRRGYQSATPARDAYSIRNTPSRNSSVATRSNSVGGSRYNQTVTRTDGNVRPDYSGTRNNSVRTQNNNTSVRTQDASTRSTIYNSSRSPRFQNNNNATRTQRSYQQSTPRTNPAQQNNNYNTQRNNSYNTQRSNNYNTQRAAPAAQPSYSAPSRSYSAPSYGGSGGNSGSRGGGGGRR